MFRQYKLSVPMSNTSGHLLHTYLTLSVHPNKSVQQNYTRSLLYNNTNASEPRKTGLFLLIKNFQYRKHNHHSGEKVNKGVKLR